MIESKLKNLLIPRALKKFPLDNIGDIFRLHDHITRRHFLQLGIGSCVATGLALDLREPWIAESQQSITVHYKNFRWKIEPKLFGSHGHVEWRRTDDEITVRLERAHFPGTDLSVNFSARLYRSLSSWYLSLTIPSIRFEASAPLEKWMSCEVPLRSKATLQQFALGNEFVKFATDTSEVAVDSSFAFLFGGKGDCVELSGSYPHCGTQLLLRPEGQRNEALNAFSEQHSKGPCSFFSILNPSSLSPIPMSARSLPAGLAFHWAKVTELSGEVFDSGVGRGSVALIEGLGAIAKTGIVSDDLRSEVVQLDSAALLVSSELDKKELALAGKVSAVPHCLDCQSWTATVVGDDEEPLFVWFGPGRTKTVRVKAKLQSVTLPISDADVCRLSVPLLPLDILLTHENTSSASDFAEARSRRKGQGEGASIIVFGKEATACFALDGADVEIQRSVDLLKLSFSFEGFDLRVKSGRGVLRRRRAPKTIKHPHGSPPIKIQSQKQQCFSQTAEGWLPGRVAVHFAPQHIAEEWFPYQDDGTGKLPEVKLPLPSRARLSGPSRIVFQVSDQKDKPKWSQRELTVDSLTEWSDLAMLVTKRSLPPNSSFEKQLAIPGITCDTDLVDAFNKIKATIQPPATMETALEMSGRLIFSPAECAKWLVPRGPIKPQNAILWHARLDAAGRNTVRAIWSQWMLPGQFGAQGYKSANPADCGDKSDLSELLVLQPRHHWELVAQTSIYGLIGLRRLEDQNQKTTAAEPEKPRSRVVRPSINYHSLEQYDTLFNNPNQDSGFALIEPLEADVILTSLGGTLGAEWNGEPLTIQQPTTDEQRAKLQAGLKGLDLPQAFNLERFVYRSYLGRDVHIETYEKGYLMPLGIRASYVELTERLFFVHPEYGYPVSYPVKRTFIVIRKPEKPLPGVYQPFDSRDFPADRILMLTKVTPDLVSPMDIKNLKPQIPRTGISVYDNGRVSIDGLPGACTDIIFWPRTALGVPGTTPGDVEFKWTLDNDQSPVLSNLLFVSNSVKASPLAMQSLAGYYREIGAKDYRDIGKDQIGAWPSLRTARFHGCRRRYAPNDQKTETSFDTDSWLLTTRGQMVPTSNNSNSKNNGGFQEAFNIDSRMEGADQPPFYPAVERAKISIQSLDRLVGVPQGSIEVRFNQNYIASGFDGQANTSQIYLDILKPQISLGVNSNGAATGSLARPNQIVAALSRKIGIVGAQRTQSPDTAPQTSYINGADTTPPPYDINQAAAGQFSPASFFSPDAKLLGLIPLSKIIDLVSDSSLASKAPKLLETTGYGPVAAAAGSAEDAFSSMAGAVAPVLKDINGLLEKIPAKINDAILKKLPKDELSFGQFDSKQLSFSLLYPGLDKAIHAFTRSSNALSASLAQISLKRNPRPKVSEVLAQASDVVGDGRELTGEIEDLVRHPVPELVQLQIENLAGEWANLKNLSLNWNQNSGASLSAAISEGLVKTLCDEVEQYKVSSLLLGGTTWAAGVVYLQGDTVTPDPANDSYYTCIQGGTSGSSQPPFPVDKGQQVVDAKVIWQNAGKTQVDACRSLADHPVSWLGRISDSLFGNSLGLPLVRGLMALKGVLPDPGTQFASIKGELRMKVYELIHTVEYEINSRTVVFNISPGGYSQLTDTAFDIIYGALNSAAEAQSDINQLSREADNQFNQIRDKLVQAVLKQSSVFRRGGVQANASIIRAFANDLATTLITNASRLANRECDGLKELMVELGNWDSTQRLSEAFKFPVEALKSSIQFALAAKSGAGLAGWTRISGRSKFPEVVRFAVVSGLGLMADSRLSSPDITQMLGFVCAGEDLDKCDNLRLGRKDRFDLVSKLRDARSTFISDAYGLTRILDHLAESSRALVEIQSQIDSGQNWPASGDLASVLHKTENILRLRMDAVRQLSVLVSDLGTIQAVLIDGLNAQPSPDELTQKGKIEGFAKTLSQGFLGLTSIGKVSNSPEWKRLKADAESLAGARGMPADSGRDLSVLLSGAESSAKNISEKISAAGGDAQKLSLAGQDVIEYLKHFDRGLGAAGLQSIALPSQALDSIAIKGSESLKQCAVIFQKINRTLLTATTTINTQLNNIPILKLILTPEIHSKLDSLAVDLGNDVRFLQNIRDSKSPVDCLNATNDLINQSWGTGALTAKQPAAIQALAFSVQLLDRIITGNVSGFLTDQAVRPILDDLLTQLRALLKQIVPTTVDLKYDWNTRLKPLSTAVFEFAMTKSTEEDLRIRSQVSVDFLTQKRSTKVMSSLQPFSLKLFGVITISFSVATFEAGDGSEGHFSADIERVTVDEKLKFLEALQSLFAPDSGSGPYLDLQPSGVEAGYRFAIGVVQLGTLQFINVALLVFVNIPFRSSGGGIGAQVGFSLSSRQRPFLIAQPPYGGGGFAQLTFREGSGGDPKLQVVLSFSFGAVVALRFGPLRGHGRVTSTIVGSSDDSIEASVEAIGEGSIGCFGICVMLQVRLLSHGGSLIGSATYSMSFKVGFLTLSFSFVVSYTISGGSSENSNSSNASAKVSGMYRPPAFVPTHLTHVALLDDLYGESAVSEKDRKATRRSLLCVRHKKIVVKAPLKSKAWNVYQQSLSMTLLCD